MKHFTVIFLLICFLTMVFSGIALANPADKPDVKPEKKPSFWVKNRHVILGLFIGILIYNHNHNDKNTPAPRPG